MFQLAYQVISWDFVKSLLEVQVNDNRGLHDVMCQGPLLKPGQEIGCCRPPRKETMLFRWYHLVRQKEISQLPCHDLLQTLTNDTCQANRSIVFGQLFISFLKYGRDYSLFPARRFPSNNKLFIKNERGPLSECLHLDRKTAGIQSGPGLVSSFNESMPFSIFSGVNKTEVISTSEQELLGSAGVAEVVESLTKTLWNCCAKQLAISSLVLSRVLVFLTLRVKVVSFEFRLRLMYVQKCFSEPSSKFCSNLNLASLMVFFVLLFC